MTSYRQKGFDGKTHSKDSAEVRINPNVIDFEISGNEDEIIRFSKTDFL